MSDGMSDSEIEDWEKFFDGLDLFSDRPDDKVLPEETSGNGFFPHPDDRFKQMLKRRAEKDMKWLRKNYPLVFQPPKPREPRQLKEDPDSRTFL